MKLIFVFFLLTILAVQPKIPATLASSKTDTGSHNALILSLLGIKERTKLILRVSVRSEFSQVFFHNTRSIFHKKCVICKVFIVLVIFLLHI